MALEVLGMDPEGFFVVAVARSSVVARHTGTLWQFDVALEW